MSSRLERLFVLLESGSSSVTRRAAAQQLGEIQKLRPRELHRLLARVYNYLRSPAWETRIAAGQAIEAILKNVPEWNPTPCEVKNEETTREAASCFDSGRLRFDTFDIEKVLAQGAHLMASEGKEYDMEDDATPGMDMREKLARQRQLLNARLGLDIASKLGMDMTDIFSNEDLMSQQMPPSSRNDLQPLEMRLSSAIIRKPMSELIPQGSQLSSREMNRARRKARQQKSIDTGETSTSEEPERKRFKADTTFKPDDNLPIYGEWLPDEEGNWGVEVEWWPLEGWASTLGADLFSSQWETRHGAATALRDLLKSHGSGAGKERGTTATQMDDMHKGWLEDISLRLLCVLALDRFGDFVSDQVVAPVRETCAQCLGVVASLMGASGASRVSHALSLLARQPHWEARHGALLGLKYLLAVQQKLGQNADAFPAVVRSLWDPVDDVAAAGAAALAPATKALLLSAPATLPPTVARLRKLLRAHDELAAACGCFMALLAALIAEPGAAHLLGPKYMASVIPRLWPYLSHPTSSVRKAALQTLRTLTQCPGTIFTPTIVDQLPTNDVIIEPCVKDNNSHDKIQNDVKIEVNVKENDKHPQGNGNSTLNTEADDDLQSNDLQIDIKADCSDANCRISNCCSDDNSGSLNDLIGADSQDENDDDDYSEWNPQLLQDALRHVFQRVLVEHIQDIKNIVEEVWNNLVKCSSLEFLLAAACPYVSTWICLTMQPAKIAFDPMHMIQSKPVALEKRTNSVITSDNLSALPGDVSMQGNGVVTLGQKWFVGGSETISMNVREGNVVRSRCIAARMIGLLSCYLVKPAPGFVYTADVDSPIECYTKILLVYLSSKSALQRLVVGLLISSWAKLDQSIKPCPPPLSSKLHECLTQPIYFDEIAVSCTRILQDTRDFISMARHYKIPLEGETCSNIVSLEQVIHFTGQFGQDLITKSKLKPRIAQTLEERRKNISVAAIQCSVEQNTFNISALAALAGACANLYALPDKVNPVIKPLMESIKKEENEQLQQISADNLAILLGQCVERQPCPNVKVLVNLCTFLRSDPEFTPKIVTKCDESSSCIDSGSGESSMDCNKIPERNNSSDSKNGILTLCMQQKQAERTVLKRSQSVNSSGVSSSQRGPGRPPATDIPLEELFPTEDEVHKQARIQRRGASFAFTSLTLYFGEELPKTLPKLWDLIMVPLTAIPQNSGSESFSVAEDVISSLQILEVVAPHIARPLLPQILSKLDRLAELLEHQFKAVRHMAARCLAAIAHIAAPIVMQLIVDKVVPMLAGLECDRRRQGAAEALACIVDKLQINIVPYIVLLVVPLLGRMSDHDDAVRLMSTHCFATLIQLMPLDGAIKEPESLSADLKAQIIRDRIFLQELFNPKSISDYKIPVPISAELRSYQQAGVNWLAFLNKYKLHGVLCDDMGLGKTLQSICMLAGDHYNREQRYSLDKNADSIPLPSLVICPPTLTGHWVYEVTKFLPSKFLNPLHYMGPPFEREKLKRRMKHHNLVVASYDIVRNDIDFFGSITWNYCILDEGHIIKNGKTKASKAIKTLVANHRLILSGTPIQNNVLELWSLFDFLMPGLLGTERQFTARYSRPILAARDPRATAQHQEAGALAMEALHRQVLPFLLRRMKEDVLTELPPKITQDYYCELSPLQRRLYEDFSRAHMPQGIDEGHEGNHQHQHVFQALRYLQNVCDHPKLVLTPHHPQYASITQELAKQNTSLNDIQHSAKLPALKQLLQDCGIGCPSSDTTSVVSQHRALIFCQLKGMLDVVEQDLLRPLLPQVSYLRLDGSIPPGQRHQLVQRFNNDPSIDVLLLTTHVGGLGLNLTGADTVIFVEHDWNPMKDLQAMDRAHRIGQKRVVNVYRLITKATLEEKIMGLQKFKLLTANTVISSENASLETMATDNLLDLFQLSDNGKGGALAGFYSGASTSQNPAGGPVSMKSILETLPVLWDDQQYESEYDMANFVLNLSKK